MGHYDQYFSEILQIVWTLASLFAAVRATEVFFGGWQLALTSFLSPPLPHLNAGQKIEHGYNFLTLCILLL